MRYSKTNSIPTYESQIFLAEIVGNDGEHRLKIVSAPYYRTFLNTKLKKGDKVTVAITDKKPKRTDAQNSYYWHYLGEISKETGNEVEALHELFKSKFIGSRIVDVMGEQVEIRGSTTQLKRLEFGEYIEKIEELTGVQAPPTESYSL